jgi:hypothetical protein
VEIDFDEIEEFKKVAFEWQSKQQKNSLKSSTY